MHARFSRSLYKLWDADTQDDARLAAVGETQDREVLYVVHIEVEENFVRIISARYATRQEKERYEKYE